MIAAADQNELHIAAVLLGEAPPAGLRLFLWQRVRPVRGQQVSRPRSGQARRADRQPSASATSSGERAYQRGAAAVGSAISALAVMTETSESRSLCCPSRPLEPRLTWWLPRPSQLSQLRTDSFCLPRALALIFPSARAPRGPAEPLRRAPSSLTPAAFSAAKGSAAAPWGPRLRAAPWSPPDPSAWPRPPSGTGGRCPSGCAPAPRTRRSGANHLWSAGITYHGRPLGLGVRLSISEKAAW